MFANKKIDVITFASSSTVKNFISMFKEKDIQELLKDVIIASIGPVTAKTVEEAGLKSKIMPEEYTIPALVNSIIEYYNKQ